MQVRESRAAGGRHAQRSWCPVSCSLDVLGDRWTLLVIRDLLRGKSRYGDFLASAEGIPTNILADRLKRPVVAALRDWGLAQFPGTRVPA